jgi:hypothetical protein
VDYASNAGWIAWNEEALRRFLDRSKMITSHTATLPTISKHEPSPRPTPPSKPNSWDWQQDYMAEVVTPSVFETKQNVFNSVPIYGHVTDEMTLDEPMLDIQEVSNHEHNLIFKNNARLTLQRAEESHQRYTRQFCNHCQGTTRKIMCLFASNYFCSLTIVKEYQPLDAGWVMQTPEQERLLAAQEEKCQSKETGRKQVLAGMTPSPGADTNWINIALQGSAKTSAVTTLMKQVHNQYQTKVSKTKEKATAVTASKKTKAKPKKSKVNKTKQPPAQIVQDISNAPKVAKEAAVGRCGCRHGDLSAIRSFGKAEAKYYIRRNKFLEGRSCLDCKLAVTNMESTARSQRSVVYYCDEGIKGFDAPDNDPMKSALTCDLILCPPCEAKRRVEYNKANSSHQSDGVRRSRQRKRR